MKLINSVKEYLEAIQEIKIENNIFFRGHSCESYVLVPGIYREVKDKKTLIEHEEQIYKEVISKAPQEFLNKTTLETLTLLQHYEAPTRVLDLTENALVALYFACINNQEEEGEVIVFDIPNKSVCHYDSDRVTILSNLAKCDDSLQYDSDFIPLYKNDVIELENKKVPHTLSASIKRVPDTKQIHVFFKKETKSIQRKLKSDYYEIKNFEEDLRKLETKYEKEYTSLNEVHKIVFTNKYIDIIQSTLNTQIKKTIKSINEKYFGKLIHHIREDKPYFDSIIDPEDISQVLAVKPKLDNPRIVRQQGAFLIFGIEQAPFMGFRSYKTMAELNKSWIIRGLGNERILIDKKNKGNILEELEQLGIDQSILFPEVDKVAGFVRTKYQNKL
ncbi:FRG domain-containing protein [Chryseobacterium rhizosphaerae]|uniref:FRG domain-containing protein n=1 Tax=Chryseobacterium rhizosphaerae TaxID=395937 RepID=UPI003D1114B2